MALVLGRSPATPLANLTGHWDGGAQDNNANFNLAIGFRVLFLNTTGRQLTGIARCTLRNNTTADYNTAIGADALRENTTGENNTAIGAMRSVATPPAERTRPRCLFAL